MYFASFEQTFAYKYLLFIISINIFQDYNLFQKFVPKYFSIN